VSRHVWGGRHGVNDAKVALFTTNPAAERHYTALGFRLVGDIYISELTKMERLYIRS
jgi:predicted GNAT superfamily acetyltransferase